MKHHIRGEHRLTTSAMGLAIAMATTAALPSLAHAQFLGVAQSVSATAGGSSSCGTIGCSGLSLSDQKSSDALGSLTLSASVAGADNFSFRAGFTYTSVMTDGVIGIREDGGASAQATAQAAQDTHPSGLASADVLGSITFDVSSATQVIVSGQDFARLTPADIPFTSSLSLSRVGANGSLTEVTARQNLFGLTRLDAGRYVLSMGQGASVSALSAYPYAGANTFITITAGPEPGTWALMGLGLLGLALASRRRQVA